MCHDAHCQVLPELGVLSRKLKDSTPFAVLPLLSAGEIETWSSLVCCAKPSDAVYLTSARSKVGRSRKKHLAEEEEPKATVSVLAGDADIGRPLYEGFASLPLK